MGVYRAQRRFWETKELDHSDPVGRRCHHAVFVDVHWSSCPPSPSNHIIDAALETTDVPIAYLTLVFFILTLMSATQDIAVDGSCCSSPLRRGHSCQVGVWKCFLLRIDISSLPVRSPPTFFSHPLPHLRRLESRLASSCRSQCSSH